MAENTLQYQWIVTITGGLDDLFAGDPAVFVAGDLFWYPVEGHPEIRMAPDTMVAFGRPKGHRGSYRQWEEGGVAPQVVFEVLSPGNRAGELSRKFGFYDRYGVEEYYIYNPDPGRFELSGFVRRQDQLQELPAMNGHVSPRLGIRFHVVDDELQLMRPDGSRFLTFQELADDRRAAHQRAEQERLRAEEALRELDQLRRQLRPAPPPTTSDGNAS
jgi:Uma2 family endonuclease